jgi:hypothetical protein
MLLLYRSKLDIFSIFKGIIYSHVAYIPKKEIALAFCVPIKLPCLTSLKVWKFEATVEMQSKLCNHVGAEEAS